MNIITEQLLLSDLEAVANHFFVDMVKAVVDIDRKIIAIDAQLHSDLEAALLDSGSAQKNLWGINFYPKADIDSFIEFDSMINLRPSQGNHSRGVEDQVTRQKIIQIVEQKIKR